MFEASETRIVITDITGKMIKVMEAGLLEKGTHMLVWNGNNEVDEPQADGVYFASITAGQNVQVMKIVLRK